jgi:predicted nuclease of predicted toxin-antitoxin system
MKLRDYSFLTDENIDAEVVEYLRQEGIDVLDIKEQHWFGMSDSDILQKSYEQNRVVVSQDSDFGTLIYRDKIDFCGVIYLRPGHISATIHVQTIKTMLQTSIEVDCPFIIVAENNQGYVKIRVRQLS